MVRFAAFAFFAPLRQKEKSQLSSYTQAYVSGPKIAIAP
jgi:hypothetical protein